FHGDGCHRIDDPLDHEGKCHPRDEIFHYCTSPPGTVGAGLAGAVAESEAGAGLAGSVAVSGDGAGLAGTVAESEAGAGLAGSMAESGAGLAGAGGLVIVGALVCPAAAGVSADTSPLTAPAAPCTSALLK